MNGREAAGFIAGTAATTLLSKKQRLQPFTHSALVFEQLGRVMAGENDRLMLILPRRHGKTLAITSAVAAWLREDPFGTFGLASYSGALAADLSRDVMAAYRATGGEFGDVRQIAQWNTPQGGGMWATGASGALTGRGAFSCMIGDDIIKGREAADSPVERENVWRWYQGVFRSPLNPGCGLIICGTRWHEDDLIGRLLEQESHDGEGREDWTVVLVDLEHDPKTLDELREQLPDNEVLGIPDRAEGDVLKWFSEKEIRRRKRNQGPREWSAQYQARPVPDGGLMFRLEDINWIDAAPPNPVARVRSWDLAGSERPTADRTVGARCLAYGYGASRRWVFDDFRFGRWNVTKRLEQIRSAAQDDGYGVKIVIEADSGIDGTNRTKAIVAGIAPYRGEIIRHGIDKEARAEGLATQIGAGHVSIVKGPWLQELRHELRLFPAGRHDDFVDAMSQAFNKIAEVAGRPREVRYVV